MPKKIWNLRFLNATHETEARVIFQEWRIRVIFVKNHAKDEKVRNIKCMSKQKLGRLYRC